MLTFDRDYGNLIYRIRMPPPIAVVYFRYFPTTPQEPAQALLRLLSVEGLVLEGYFTVLERRQSFLENYGICQLLKVSFFDRYRIFQKN